MKKFIAITLSCLMLASLVSCSGKGNETMNDNSSTSKTSAFTKAASIAAAPLTTVVTTKATTAKTTKSKKSESKTSKSKAKPNSKIKTVTPTAKPARPTAKPKVTIAPKSAETKKDTGKKYIALTFDDGPNTVTTPLVLDKLEKYGVVASFFLCGQNLNEDVKPVLQRQLELGCEINNHSWSHPYMNKMTKEEIIKQVQDTNDKIYELVGVTPKFFRPPYIATSPDMYKYIDLPFICGVGCDDWNPKVTTQKRAKTIIDWIKDGEIILLHDASGNSQTVDALDEIIPSLLDKGYEFVTVSKLFELKGVEPNVENKIWTNTSW